MFAGKEKREREEELGNVFLYFFFFFFFFLSFLVSQWKREKGRDRERNDSERWVTLPFNLYRRAEQVNVNRLRFGDYYGIDTNYYYYQSIVI